MASRKTHHVSPSIKIDSQRDFEIFLKRLGCSRVGRSVFQVSLNVLQWCSDTSLYIFMSVDVLACVCVNVWQRQTDVACAGSHRYILPPLLLTKVQRVSSKGVWQVFTERPRLRAPRSEFPAADRFMSRGNSGWFKKKRKSADSNRS